MQVSQLFGKTDLADVEALLRRVKHPAVLPVLRLARVSCLFNVDRYEAIAAYDALVRDYPLIPVDSLLDVAEWQIKEARAVRDWTDAKLRSPRVSAREDYDHLKNRGNHAYSELTQRERDRLTRGLGKLKTANLTALQRIGRHFMLVKCGHDRETQLKAMIGIAESHPKHVVEVLELLA